MDTSSSSAGVSGGRMVASRAASIDLPAPGGPTINRLWPAGGGDLERALGALLALDVLEVDQRAAGLADLRLRAREHLRAAEMIGELDQRARRR